MAKAHAPNGRETSVRVIVFREGDQYIAQCLEYDIATQSRTVEGVIDRLELTMDAEFAFCHEAGKEPRELIAPAPNYYHDLWDSQFASLHRKSMPKPDGVPNFEVALARAA